MRSQKGFTIVELIISMGIFSIILAGITMAFIQQSRMNNATRETTEMQQAARVALELIATRIKSAAARQGKTFSLSFINEGGSKCENNPGGDSPDCLTIYTWDTGGGFSASQKRATSNIELIPTASTIKLKLPEEMYKELMKKSTETKRLGLRSRIKLCHPNSKEFVVDGSVDCGANPERCTECSAVLETKTRDNALKALEFTDLTSIVQQNFVSQDKLGFLFPSMDDFKKRAFIPAFTNVSSELSIVERSAFRIDTKKGELEKNTQPAVGGEGAPRIVDLQFVFTLDDGDGTSTRVGVPEDTERGMYADFTHPDLLGREKDIRTVEIYVVVRSVGVIPLTGGASTPEKRIPRIADWSEEVRTFGGGFLYKLFSTTVYLRNYSREEYG